MTGLAVIKSALRQLGVIGEGQTPSASEQADALEIFNALLDSWSTQRINLYTVSYADFPLASSQQLYTMGTGGTFNTARPVKIQDVVILVPNAASSQPTVDWARVPIEIITDANVWAQVRQRFALSSIPEKVYISYAFPLNQLYFWPMPSFGGTTPRVEIFSWVPLARFTDVSTDYTFPEGYELLFKTNLAVLLAPEYNMPASQELLTNAKMALDNVRAFNIANLPPIPGMAA